ncbi:hypothetical protein ACLEJR_10000, partial [Pseudomonas sp. SMN5]
MGRPRSKAKAKAKAKARRPKGSAWCFRLYPDPIVGASLLAMAAVHPTLMQAEPPPSRASPLPQFFALSEN